MMMTVVFNPTFTFFFTQFLILGVGVGIFYLMKRIHLPALVGYLLWGIALGVLAKQYPDLFDERILSISSEIRKIALIIILLKAGLSLDVSDLKKVGRPAILMSFLPACVEMVTIGVLGPLFFPELSYVESFMLGSVLGAVSPAVVVPMMTKLMDEKRGTKHGVPQLIIAGSSIDDIIMIVFFQAFMTMEKGGEISWISFLNIPSSIITGVAIGLLFGLLMHLLFSHVHMRDSFKLILLFALSFGLTALEESVSSYFGFSSLLSIISIGIFLNTRNHLQSTRLASRSSKMWVLAEIFLFTLVGMCIQIEYASKYFALALGLLCCSLFFRAIALFIATTHSGLSKTERGYTILSYMPKATVQAAIGGQLYDYALTNNRPELMAAGIIILSVSVVSILLTAPLFATLMNLLYKKMLPDDSIPVSKPNAQ